ncbi:neprilysin-4 [Aplysia californica]|uniref:Neprilysin-4 n=1 Tax=Aplysia californica TaxID=6500 RepID=A0ABM1A3A7_APLCA|nr:neprilysin-4 [Aplysia californica]
MLSKREKGQFPSNYDAVWTEEESSDGDNREVRLSPLTIALIVLLVLALLAVVGLVAFMLLTTNDRAGRGVAVSEKPTCTSPACITEASRILNSLDNSVQPCDDFYQFACGGWMSRQLIPEYSSRFTVFSELRETVNVQLKNILEEAPQPGENSAVRNAKNFYISCEKDDVLESRGDKHFKAWIKAQFGGWPLTSPTWDETFFDLTDFLIRTSRYGANGIISLFVAIDLKNSDSYVLTMDQPSPGMPGQKYYQVERNDSMLAAYQSWIYNQARTLGLSDPDSAEREVADIVDFEIELMKISVPSEERRDSNSLYNPMTLGEVQGNYSQETGIDFLRYLTSLTSAPDVGVTDVTVDERIINRSPLYYSRLGQVLAKTPKRTIANYVMSRVAMRYTPTLTQIYRDYRQDYRKVVFGTSNEKRRDLSCSSLASKIMDMAVGRGYVRKHFDPAAKSEAVQMVGYLQTAFNELVDELEWMDDKTKAVAKEKNEFIEPRIGYSESIYNNTKLNERFVNVTFYPDKYFENNVHITKESSAHNWRRLRQPVDKEEWFDTPHTVNAFYSSSRNEISFPAGILQPPFFHKDFPKSVNFGAIGTVMGHEITHGFDDRGRQFDKDGNLLQWWEDEAIEKFKKQTGCLVDQYSNYTVEQVDMNLNGIKTQGENIADNGGVKQSFWAYKNWVSTHSEKDPALPGLNFTHNQLYFLAFAQIWCAVERKEGLINRVRTGSHSPGRFRVIGSVQNSEDFAKAFNCPKGSPMNPEKKCNVW